MTCMRSVRNAYDDLENPEKNQDELLVRITRALLLLKTYLETFRRRYAYHFRRMSIEGQGVSTHAELIEANSASPLKILVQTAGYQEKVTFEMQSTDLLAELRAEIQAWWEVKLNQLKMQLSQQQVRTANNSNLVYR